MADTVFIKQWEDDFHIVSQSNRSGREVPRDEWLAHVEKRSAYRDSRTHLNRYFKPPRDKPMRVERYHVDEGEIVKFD